MFSMYYYYRASIFPLNLTNFNIVKIGQVVLVKKTKNVKTYNDDDDNDR